MSNTSLLFLAVTVATTLTLALGRVPSFWNLPPASETGLLVAPAIDPTSAGPVTQAQLANGAKIYRTLCLACHLPDGRGMPAVIPPLAQSDFLLDDRARAVRIVLKGLSGPITVNTIGYNGVMPPLEAVLSDRQIADVLSYVFNTWDNQGDAFDEVHIAAIRAQHH